MMTKGYDTLNHVCLLAQACDCLRDELLSLKMIIF